MALAVAALLVGLDHYGGPITGWVHDVRTDQGPTLLQGDFQLDREGHRRARWHQPEDPEQVKAAILLCRKFLQGVHELLRLETELWAQEFQQALSAVESNAGFTFPGTGGSRLPPQEAA